MHTWRTPIWTRIAAGLAAAATAAAAALVTMLLMDRYVGTMLVPIGMAVGFAARWTGGRSARWLALGHAVLGITAVWLLLPGLVQGVAQGKFHLSSLVSPIPLGEFFSKHYFHGALDILSPLIALVAAWFLAIPKQAPVPANPAPPAPINPG